MGSSDFSHTGEEKQATVKYQTYLPQKQIIVLVIV